MKVELKHVQRPVVEYVYVAVIELSMQERLDLIQVLREVEGLTGSERCLVADLLRGLGVNP